MKKKDYKHLLSVVTLLHMLLLVLKSSNLILLFSPRFGQNLNAVASLFSPSTMEYESGFIDLWRIGMVEKMVGEVEGRSY